MELTRWPNGFRGHLSADVHAGGRTRQACAVDVDGDGWEDLTFGNDLHGIDLYLRDSVGFEAHLVELGLEPGDCTPRSVVWADMDNDADQDLFLTCRMGPNRIYRNLGGLVMQDITDSCGIVVKQRTRATASIADINLDGHLDLFTITPVRSPSVPTSSSRGMAQGISPDRLGPFPGPLRPRIRASSSTSTTTTDWTCT